MAIRAGRFKARGIVGSQHYGTSSKGTPVITINLGVPELGTTLGVYLYFSAGSAPFSLERLRALGWDGKDIRDLSTIGANEVEIEVKQEVFEGKANWKVEILSGGGAKPAEELTPDAFAARLQAIIGSAPNGQGTSSSGGSAARGPVIGDDDQIPFAVPWDVIPRIVR